MTDEELWDYISSKEKLNKTAPKEVKAKEELNDLFKEWVSEYKKDDEELSYLNDWADDI